MHTLSIYLVGAIGTLLLTACTTVPSPPAADVQTFEHMLKQTPAPSVLLLGEQHDVPEHQQWQLTTVRTLIARQQLAALVLEMADQGQSTAHLPDTASEAAVQAALQWSTRNWPWQAYGPSIMAAVRAGIPVAGGNLPRQQMPRVMQQPEWDQHLSAAAWKRQHTAIRVGHCHLLPEKQIVPMARVQLAKDALMAHAAQTHMQPGKTVVLIAGQGHVLRGVGIPTWLASTTPHVVALAQAGDQAVGLPSDHDYLVPTPARPGVDHCSTLRQQWGTPTSP